MIRRTFLKDTSVAGIGLSTMSAWDLNVTKRNFKICLNPGAIGVKANQEQLLAFAKKYNFEAMVALTDELNKWDSSQRKDFVDKMKDMNIHWGASFLPLDFRKDQKTFEEGLKELPLHARTLQSVGGGRMSTWIMPTHDALTYRENFQLHAERLQQVANILGHYGIRFGLEYVGPKTLMARDRHPFVHSMRETKELIEAMGEPNVGFVLDSYHWHCAQEGASDILTLDKEQIVTVDLNDAVAGRDVYHQIDNERELPGRSGVIDIKAFIQALKTMGYDGPVRAEPFNKVLNEMGDDEAIRSTFDAMKAVCDL